MRRKLTVIASLLCLGLLSACGIRGDLKRPDPIVKRSEQPQSQVAPSPSNFSAVQQDAGASIPN